MCRSLNSGPFSGPQYSAAPILYKGPYKDPSLDNYPNKRTLNPKPLTGYEGESAPA